MTTRTLDDLPVNWQLYEKITRGEGLIGNINANVGKTWVQNVCRLGGFWLATCEWEGPEWEKLDLFLESLMRGIKVEGSGQTLFEGLLGEMKLTWKGQEYVKNWGEIANRVKCIYTHIGNNLFTNGSAETSAWSAVGTPTTLAQSTTWVSDGVYSCHIVTDAINEGGLIQAAMAISANKYYECRCTVEVISGSWALEIYTDDASATILASASVSNTGLIVLRSSIDNKNEYAGNVGIRLVCKDASGEAYGDGAVFQEGPNRAETGWFEDTSSQAEYGKLEQILLKAGMADAAAEGLCKTYLAKYAWPHINAPTMLALDNIAGETKLEMTWIGYAWTLKSPYSLISGTDTASNQVSALVAASEFVSAGVIAANTMQYQIDDQAPLTLWEILKDIAESGDASGNLWGFGVYAERKAEYRAWETACETHVNNGILYNLAGGEMEPWLMKPGMMYLDDLPAGPMGTSGYERDDPRVQVIDDVEWSVAEWLNGKIGLTLKNHSQEGRLEKLMRLEQAIKTQTFSRNGGIRAPIGYTINVQALTSDPTDAQTVYFGALPKAPVTTAAMSKIHITKAGFIKAVKILCYSTTAGSNEAWSLYVRKNNTTDTLIATLSAATNERVFSNTGLSISVAAGDYIEIKGVQPTWATNPLGTIYGGYIYIE